MCVPAYKFLVRVLHIRFLMRFATRAVLLVITVHLSEEKNQIFEDYRVRGGGIVGLVYRSFWASVSGSFRGVSLSSHSVELEGSH